MDNNGSQHNPFLSIEERFDTIEDKISKLIALAEANLKPSETSENERLTRKDVGRIYKISMGTLHKLMRNGLEFHKVGRKTLFKRGTCESYFMQHQN